MALAQGQPIKYDDINNLHNNSVTVGSSVPGDTGGVLLSTDTEGGSVNIYERDNETNWWHIDAYNGKLRLINQNIVPCSSFSNDSGLQWFSTTLFNSSIARGTHYTLSDTIDNYTFIFATAYNTLGWYIGPSLFPAKLYTLYQSGRNLVLSTENDTITIQFPRSTQLYVNSYTLLSGSISTLSIFGLNNIG